MADYYQEVFAIANTFEVNIADDLILREIATEYFDKKQNAHRNKTITTNTLYITRAMELLITKL